MNSNRNNSSNRNDIDNSNDKVVSYHLSHTDLDGYSCQLIASEYFDNIKYFNANYGDEVRVNIEQIVNLIKQEDKDKKIYFFITDLNLNEDESKWLNREYKDILEKGLDLELILLDHHKTGIQSSEIYDWYYLDINRSATKITYDYFRENNFKIINKIDKLDRFVKAVNAVDLWLEDDELFEFGKTCMSMINASNSINKILFEEENREFKYFLLKHSIEFIDKKDGHILLDDEVHFLKKKFLNPSNIPDTLENLKANFITKLLEKNKERFTIKFKEYKGLFTYSLGSISIPANRFLKDNPDYHFFLDLSKNGAISLRADNKFDVSEFAKLIAEGGGHKNAAGGKFKNFKEVYRYEDAKEFIEKELLKYL